MSLPRIKNEVAANRIQICLLDPDGILRESCHTHLDFRAAMGTDILSDILIFTGLREVILAMQPEEAPLRLPLVEFEYGDAHLLVNMEFFADAETGQIVWVISTNPEFQYKLREIQQERNDSAILLETIRLQQKKLQAHTERLESVNQNLDRFAYIVSHDLKAPLRAIANLATWIEEGIREGDMEDVRTHTRLLEKRVNRMENLIGGILEYSRTGREATRIESVDIGQLVREILEEEHPDLDCEVVVADRFPVLDTIRTWLHQIFSNLISNAVKYGRSENCRIEIGYRELADGHEFSVADNGPGIDPKHHERVFEIFQTLQSRDHYESTGIGLTIVKKLVEEAGGVIKVVSELGKGARFVFTWPGEN